MHTYNPTYTPNAPEHGPELAESATQPDLFEDDLFAVSKVQPRRTKSITCLVCGLFKEVPITVQVQLCTDCIADPAAKRAELHERQQTLVANQERTWDMWCAVEASLLPSSCDPNYSDDTKQRWQNIKIARARGVKQDRIAAIAADEADPLCAILKAEAENAATLYFVEGQLASIKRALAELDRLQTDTHLPR